MRESDYKLFRQLQTVALDRFCARVLSETSRIASDGSKSNHERYLALYQHLREKDRELALLFDNPRRSTASIQLAGIWIRRLLTEEEKARFSAETREAVELMTRE
jgi:hypothetical protein